MGHARGVGGGARRLWSGHHEVGSRPEVVVVQVLVVGRIDQLIGSKDCRTTPRLDVLASRDPPGEGLRVRAGVRARVRLRVRGGVRVRVGVVAAHFEPSLEIVRRRRGEEPAASDPTPFAPVGLPRSLACSPEMRHACGRRNMRAARFMASFSAISCVRLDSST